MDYHESSVARNAKTYYIGSESPDFRDGAEGRKYICDGCGHTYVSKREVYLCSECGEDTRLAPIGSKMALYA